MTTGRINQVAPSMTPARMSRPEPAGGQHAHGRRSFPAKNASLGIRIHVVEALPAQCSASRSTPRGHSPSRARTATQRGWTTAPARRVHPTPQGGIERRIISLGSKLPSRGMQHRKPSFAQGLPAPGSSPEEDRAWAVHRSSREPANANEPNATHAPPRVPAEMHPACPLDYGTHRRTEQQGEARRAPLGAKGNRSQPTYSHRGTWRMKGRRRGWVVEVLPSGGGVKVLSSGGGLRTRSKLVCTRGFLVDLEGNRVGF